jgi:hypothetical protein
MAQTRGIGGKPKPGGSSHPKPGTDTGRPTSRPKPPPANPTQPGR